MSEIKVEKDGTKTCHVDIKDLNLAYSELISVKDYISEDG